MNAAVAAMSQPAPSVGASALCHLSLDCIEVQPGFNPRLWFDEEEFADLVTSIREKRWIQPILVRPQSGREGFYWIVAGERRWRAARELGFDTIPAEIRELSDEHALAFAHSENDDRAGVTPGEEARTALRMMRFTQGDRAEAARRLGWSPSTLDARLLLTQASEAVLLALARRKIKLGHAELLSCLPETTQAGTLQDVIERNLPVEELRAKLDAFALDLGTACFNLDGCRACPHNTTRQASLFEQHVGEGRCTNRPCFHQKTVEHLQEQRTALKDEHNAVYLDTERHRDSWTLVLKRDVGATQLNEGCKQCAHFGCLLSTRPGEAGRLTTEVCFNLSCHAQKKAEYAAQQSADSALALIPQDAGATVSTRSAKQNSKQGKPAASSAPPKRVLSLVHALHRKAAAIEVLRSPKMAQVYAVLALLKELDLLQGERDAHDPLQKRGIRRQSRPDHRTALLGPLFALDPETLSEIMVELASMIAARELGDTEVQPRYLNGAQATLRTLQVDLASHFALDAEFLEAHTKAGIDAILRQAGFPDYLTAHTNDADAYKKLLARKHSEIVKDVLASGFDFTRFVPPVVKQQVT